MHKIIVTSTKFKGSLEFEMQDDEMVRTFHNLADLTPDQITWLSGNFPLNLTLINSFINSSASIKGELVELEVTFEMFWDKYGLKRNRIKALRFWDKHTTADQLMAYRNIDPYNAYLDRNPHQQKLYPDTYLNPKERRFENDYR